jgi:hypothetical protein
MKRTNLTMSRGLVTGSPLLILCLLSATTTAAGQYPGDKAVYSGPLSTTFSHNYIDASTLVSQGSPDVCGAIAAALINLKNESSYPLWYYKSVIDARGIFNPSTGGSLTCSTSPWPGSPGLYNGLDVTVLLPAGIIGGNSTTSPGLSTTWELPSNTRLVGEGVNVTTLKFTLTSPPGNMIDLGYFAPPPNGTLPCQNCGGIVLEHLGLVNAGSGTVSGIFNNGAQELNYVNDVALTGITGTGLTILGESYLVGGDQQGYADNSGPYSNIYFSGSGTCVNINGTYGTRGIRGLTCNGTSSAPAILLDGSNNTIEDVSITGYTGEGIVIGSRGTYAQGNLLFNITGSGTLTNLVHIKNPSGGPPTDTTLMGISGGTTTIQDDVTSSKITDSPVGLYILGEPMAQTGTPSGYSRFTTSSSSPAWFVGPSGSISSGSLCTSVANGSLFSFTSIVASAPTLLGCIGGTWTGLSGSH